MILPRKYSIISLLDGVYTQSIACGVTIHTEMTRLQQCLFTTTLSTLYFETVARLLQCRDNVATTLSQGQALSQSCYNLGKTLYLNLRQDCHKVATTSS